MKVLLTGAKGQLGIELIKQLKDLPNTAVMETDIHNLDITNKTEVEIIVYNYRPDVIINCAALVKADFSETNEEITYSINSIGPQNLAIAAKKIGAKIVHVSSDYVFDGEIVKKRREFDATNPQTVYGKSKVWGEDLVRESNDKHYIFRTAWLYGEGENFVRIMLRLSKEKEQLDIVADQFGTPTSTVDLSKCIINLIQTDYYGTYHATCEGECSWYDFTKKIFELKNINTKVNKITTEQLNRPAKRPKYSVLENFKLNLIGLNTFRNWEEALIEYLKGENYEV